MNKVIITITDPRSTAELINEVRARLEPMGIMDLEIRAEGVSDEDFDERELWKFAERTAKEVESWPAWKKEGWHPLDKQLDELTREQVTDRPPFVSVDI